ncbi:2-dehydro-3-deoxygluconokinase [Gemmata obscuriglobus]|uniref:Sugar kinase n=1 Tax=Gemmata obscuriglobus TaxID=114 RepID=A0A2Z3H615_9BACT|nr:sugar kinase [Gemmata obscuriglobus]AWM39006.1 sugar kinase [Gemmata obscuriglobus]QEG27969.1 2-dehydro-3-deoxygluconokinase [Gemmata obscuriglobus]VTS05464.1 Ribokinase-like domain-containing protein OS=uncultured organism GN=FLSS-18_0020 PE=4 SV=1: PfkB [Gemmata obscuriglobus UQM 2246]
MADVVTFGEAMVRLAPPNFQRLEQARSLDLEIGGAELNTAAGLARLGHPVEWVSRLPNNPLGALITNRVREVGVSDRFVQFADDGRCGLYFLEFGASPRASSILYDRKDSSVSLAQCGMFDWEAIFRGAKWFHVSGITPALSPGAAEVVDEAMHAARDAGVKVCMDLNYRSKLWGCEHAAEVLGILLPQVDALIASEADAEHLFGITGADFAEVAAGLVSRFGVKTVVGTRREAPLVWRNRFAAVGYTDGRTYESAWYEVEIVDRLGAGDALAAGLIHGLLDGDLKKGLDYGAAMGALKHTLPGDLPWLTKDEVEAAMQGQGLRIKR